MINNSKWLAFLGMAALLMVTATARYYSYSDQPYDDKEHEPSSYYNYNKEEPKSPAPGLVSGSVEVPGLVHGKGTTGSNPSASLESGPVALSGSTNPLSGSATIGPVHAQGTAKKPMNGCIKAPGLEGCAKSGHPMKGHLKTPAGTISGNVKTPADPELPVQGVSLP